MNVVDASAWIEYFADGPNAYFFAPSIEDTECLLVPAATLGEVFYTVLRRRNQADALAAVAVMQQGRVVPLDSHLALNAAKLRLDLGLSVLTSITLATARAANATLWTQDDRLAEVRDVRYVKKRRARRERR